MTAHNDLDRDLNVFLREGPTELPNESFDAVRDRSEQTRQRVVLGPWRLPEMNKIVTIGLGAAAVVVLVFVGTQLFGGPSGVGSDPNRTAEPTATSEPTATAEPSPTPEPPPALTETFTSERHGFSISYPAGWVTRPATEPWTSGFPNFASTDGDVIFEPILRDKLWILVASQPETNKTGEEWVDEALTGLSSAGVCEAPREALAIDGAQGGKCASSVAVLWAGGRGYLIWLHVSPDYPEVGATFDQAWFEEVLSTIQIRPQDAVD